MDKFLHRSKPTQKSEGPVVQITDTPAKSTKHSSKRKYNESYISFGFVNVEIHDEHRPKCVVCGEVLANESLRPSKLKRHLERNHPDKASESLAFFKRKALATSTESFHFEQSFSSASAAALEASFVLSERIAVSKKPFTVGEQLVLPCIVDAAEIVLGAAAANKLRTIALSGDTVARRIEDMAADVEVQLIKRVQTSPVYAIQLDESTDVSSCAQLLCFIRFIHGGSFQEELLFCKSLPLRTTAEDIFNLLDAYICDHGIGWENCRGVCTDGAAAMTGRKSGLVTRVQAVAPHAKATHCFIHREALVAKKIPLDLKKVLTDSVTIVNFIKSRPLNSRLFTALCSEMDSKHETLLLHTEVRWLSRGRVLFRLHELHEEVGRFLKEHSHHLADDFAQDDFLFRLAYLSDICEKLNVLNRSLQGRDTNCIQLIEKVQAFVRKLSMWITNIQDDRWDMFTSACDRVVNGSVSADYKASVVAHLEGLRDSFHHYFRELVTQEKLQWIQTPISQVAAFNHLPATAQEELIDLQCDSTLVSTLKDICVSDFWIRASASYPEVARLALDTLTPFATAYLCEVTFSALTVIKTKHRNSLHVENPLRLAESNIQPRIKKLCSGKQPQVSH